MITKERLEELIEQGATIYEIVSGGCIFNYYLKEMPSYSRKHLDLFLEFHKVFETKEEAEWHKEFGCIERTERLELPTWEEFNKFFNNEVTFYDKNNNSIRLTRRNDILLWTSFDNGRYLFQKPRTKKNYTLACRKAKELFLGEKK